MSGRGRVCAGLMLAVVFCAASAQGSIFYTSLIDTSFPNFMWYDYISGTDGHFNFNGTTINGEKKLYTYGNPYTFTINGTFTFNPDLAQDYSSGGLAKGYFEGGALVTITGGLRIGSTYYYGGTGAAAKQIFQARMIFVNEDDANPTLDRWALEEELYEPGKFNAGLFLEMVEGSEGLASGITLTTGDILKMSDPKMDLFMKANDAVNFYTDMGPIFEASPIKITGLTPEPATLLLLGLGTLCLKRKR